MLSKLYGFFARIESDKTPIVYWIASFFAIILLRNLIEGMLSSCHCVFNANSFFVTLALPYVVLLLALAILLRVITRAKTASVMKILIVFFSLLLVVPVVDFFASGGSGERLLYLQGDMWQMISNFWTLYSGSATTGQIVEGSAFALLLMLYVYAKTKSMLKAAGGVFLAYCIILFFAALSPLAFATSQLLFGPPDKGSLLFSSGLGKELYRAYFSGLLTVLFSSFVIATEVTMLLAVTSKRKFLLLLKAIRPIRSAHYMLLATFGILLGVSATQCWKFGFYNLFSVGYVIAVFFAHQFACLINDYFDKDLHVRVKSKQSKGDWHAIKLASFAYLILALAAAYPAGYEGTVFLIGTIILAFLYSAPPIRLKRFPIVASATLALLALLVVLGGFSVFAKSQSVKLFPGDVALAILLVYTLGTNYKDLKGIELDKKDRVCTIPVLLGEKKGKLLICVMTVLSFLLVPLILNAPDLIAPSIIAALLSIVFIAKDSNEKIFRTMHLCYFILMIYSIITWAK